MSARFTSDATWPSGAAARAPSAAAPPVEFIAQVAVLGNSGAGKTSLFDRLTHTARRERASFELGTMSTIGLEFKTVTYTFTPPGAAGRVIAKLQLLDTSGQERFNGITQQHLRNKDAVLFVFDAAAPDTLRALPHWSALLDSACAAADGDAAARRPARALVAAKTDTLMRGASAAPALTADQRALLEAQRARCADADGPLRKVFWTSAKSGDGVLALLDALAAALYARHVAGALAPATARPITDSPTIRLHETPPAPPAGARRACCGA